MLPTKRALALAALLTLALPIAQAQAQSGAVRVELTPDSVTTTLGLEANVTVRVYNAGLSPIVVALNASNVTGGLDLSFDTMQLNVLPGGSAATGLRVRAASAGDWRATIHADGRSAIGGAPMGNASATLFVKVQKPSSNGTANATPSAPPAAPAPSASHPPRASSPPTTDTTAPPNEATPADAPPPPRAMASEITLEAHRGEQAPFRVAIQNPASVAQRVDVTLELPLGWAGQLDALWLDVPAGGTAEARGIVVPGSQARDDEGALRFRAPSGAVNVRLAFRVLAPAPEPAAQPAPEPDPVVPTAFDARDARPIVPATPTLRIVPDEVGARPGTSVLFTVYIANPGDAPLEGHLRADAPPLALSMDDPAFRAAARDEASVTFVVTIPADASEGTSYEGVASTSVAETSVPFRVRIETAEAAPVTTVATASDDGASRVLVGAASAGLAAAGVGLAWRRWPMLGLVPLYARFAPGRALDHPRRQAMIALLRAEPGLTLAELRRRIGMSNGVARHHLQLLEAAGVVRAVPDGALKRLWPVGEVVKPVPPLRERALDALRSRGAMRTSELADALGVSRQALHYHVKRLLDEGRIVARREANEITLAVITT